LPRTIVTMNPRLPPLNALRAFETAARHLSFRRAAEELFVTPAAISHQIKGLEDYLGVTLFHRLNKSLLLTEAGQAALPALRDGFERLAEAVEILRADSPSRLLTVSVAPSFASKWLVPRLERFRRSVPGIDIRIDATSRCVDFIRDRVDVGIRYGAGDYPGLHSDCLRDDEVMPVCSPALLAGKYPLQQPDDLRHHTLLHIDDPVIASGWPDWSMWLASAGNEAADASRGSRFSMASMAIQAAVEGHGVALVSAVLVEDDLAAGRLVKPFCLRTPVKFCYYLVCPLAAVARPTVAAFRAWLLAEIDVTARAPLLETGD